MKEKSTLLGSSERSSRANPLYYHVLACCLEPWLSRSEPFSVDSMGKQSRVQPCHAQVTSPPLVAAAFPTQGSWGPGVKVF